MRLLILFWGAAALAACVPVEGERILARDMTRAAPAFAALAPELVLGYAPPPGARRTYGTAELTRLARRFGLTADPGAEACFTRPQETLSRERVAAALQAAWPAAHVDLVDFSRQPVPPGEVIFPLPGLQTDAISSAACLWRGAVRQSGQADFPIWARVRLSVPGTRMVAVETLRVGEPIRTSQVRQESGEGPPGFADAAQVVGWVPQRTIPAGIAVQARWIAAPADIVKGQPVVLEVRSGTARLLLDCQAQSSGRRGQVIRVRSAVNGKILRATVQDRARVLLTTDAKPVTDGEKR